MKKMSKPTAANRQKKMSISVADSMRTLLFNGECLLLLIYVFGPIYRSWNFLYTYMKAVAQHKFCNPIFMGSVQTFSQPKIERRFL